VAYGFGTPPGRDFGRPVDLFPEPTEKRVCRPISTGIDSVPSKHDPFERLADILENISRIESYA
jgi:hypothetical protein